MILSNNARINSISPRIALSKMVANFFLSLSLSLKLVIVVVDVVVVVRLQLLLLLLLPITFLFCFVLQQTEYLWVKRVECAGE